ncbi:uncharacterized protein DUF4365 [Hydrogenispora ethanolica]|uniref:Uncharacterized protein DUF4365 n=1 Tax=Hydrogenispora ethanolica TaxID=1082276 RepID=A0A4R1RBY4_HYDET|nr:DUF4365 domain-containing protein [Hydrogenispora ethanolica]TCL63321.1 uncharacterized protein DUF4365 [Hydrogenispora ethanolica]
MTTKRPVTKSTARKGVNYVRSIVDSYNCIFQEIDLENDVGNDAIIEFIKNEETTSLCIGVQIKAGNSNIHNDYYSLKADKEHFEYWKNHILPIIGIVYNPQDNNAVWVDISEYLKSNSALINKGPYVIKISKSNLFSQETFSEIMDYYLKYQRQYKDEDNFGKSLELFADIKNINQCQDGIISLFYNHRNRKAAWFYLINCFKCIKDESVLNRLIFALCHIPGHGDIFWYKNNIIDENTRTYAQEVMADSFGEAEITKLLSAIDENGIQRGTLGQCVHSIIDICPNKTTFLEKISFNKTISEEIRIHAFYLCIYYIQFKDLERAKVIAKEYLAQNNHSDYYDIIKEIIETLKKSAFVGLY